MHYEHVVLAKWSNHREDQSSSIYSKHMLRERYHKAVFILEQWNRNDYKDDANYATYCTIEIWMNVARN